jgi:hypothetical protein
MTKITEINPGINSIIEREATEEELAQFASDAADSLVRQAELKAEEKAKTALLKKLGITADEAALLLG